MIGLLAGVTGIASGNISLNPAVSIALACDEHDLVSSITDVLIDGVFLNNADQGIRLLSRGTGRVESLTLRNIYLHQPHDNRPILEIGWPQEHDFHTATISNIDSLLIDGLNVYQPYDELPNTSLIIVSVEVNTLNIRNVQIIKSDDSPHHVCMIETRRTAKINNLYLNNIQANRMQCLLLHKTGEIGKVQLHNIFFSDSDAALLELEDGNIQQLFPGEVFGANLISFVGKGKVG